jgi:muramidase (phage lysozyme)
MADLKFFQQFAGTPAGQGLLRAIRAGEGTAGPKGYQTMFGGGTFNDLSRHPDRVIRSGGYASAAAGAYQFLPGTWNEVAGRLGLKDFSPRSQDVAALAKARERLMPLGGLAVVEKEGLSPRVAAALAPEWASFPTMSGKSYYGQPVKSLSTLQQAFGQGRTAAPATSQPAQQAAQAVQIPTPQAKANSLLDMFKQEVMLGLLSPGVSALPTSDPFSLLGLLGR